MDGIFLEFAGKSELRKGIACEKVFKNGPNKICGRQPLKNFTWSILEYFAPHPK